MRPALHPAHRSEPSRPRTERSRHRRDLRSSRTSVRRLPPCTGRTPDGGRLANARRLVAAGIALLGAAITLLAVALAASRLFGG